MTIANELKELLADHQLYHSALQMDHFITARAGGPTPYGQYKQALRELYKRYRGLKDLATQKALLEVDIDELKQSNAMGFELRRNEIKLRQKQMEMEDLERNIADTQREFKRFFAQAVALKKVIGPLDNEEFRNELDREMWEENIKRRCALDYATRGGLSESSIETLSCLPRETRHRLVEAVSQKNKESLLAWFYDQQCELPALELNDDSHRITEALLEYTGGSAPERLA